MTAGVRRPDVSWLFTTPLGRLVAAVLLAVLAVVFGMLATTFGQDVPVAPRAVRAGEPVGLPDAGPVRRSTSLYAATVSPSLRSKDLGCTFRSAQGTAASVFLTTLQSGEGPLTVEGRVLQPMAFLDRIGTGTTMTCTGPAITASQPVYLVRANRPPDLGALLAGLLGAASAVGAVASAVLGILGVRRRRSA